MRLAILLIFPVALFLYLSVQSRFFGRWLLPVYPALALLAGYAFVQGARRWCGRGRRGCSGRRSRVGLVLLLWQPLAADARSMAVLGREDTRAIARQWLAEHDRRELRAIIEPAVPERYYWPVARRPAAAAPARAVRQRVHPRHPRGRTSSTAARCARAVLDRYRAEGYCTVMTFDLIRGRAEAAGDRAALAYYDALERESDVVFRRQPVPGRRRAAAVQLRPQLQLLLAGLRAARARGGGPPPARLHAALRAAGGGVSGRRAGARCWARSCSCALALRLWHLDHGLPFAYNADEAEHFVPKAIEMFRGGLDPGYYENPSALTYLLYGLFKLRFTAGFPFGGGRGLVREFAADPEAAFLTARVAVALIGTLVVGLAYWAGTRFYERRVGLVAAALMAVAFLPVFYSKHALNDVVTLAPVTRRARRVPARLRARLVVRLGARGRGDRRRDRDEVHGGRDAARRCSSPPACACSATAAQLQAGARGPRDRGRGLPRRASRC